MIVRFLGFLFTLGVILLITGASVAGYMIWKVEQDLPDYEVLAKYEPPVMTRVHASNGQLLAEFARQRRLFIPIEVIPERMVQAILSAEDKNFYDHGGIDYIGLARAVMVNVQNRLSGSRRLVGASTITQQVAKNFLLSSEQNITRKLKEALLALRIESAFSKDKILELYLNEIFFGLGAYGIAAASMNYYDKSLTELSLSEIAYLAALPKAPNNYHPYRKTEAAKTRRNWVIDRMVANGYVTVEEAAAAKATELKVNPRKFGSQIFAAEYFSEEVRRQVIGIYGEKRLYEGGLSVRTTLVPALQKEAKRALVNGLVRFDRKKGWRGPVDKIATGGDWGATLVKMDSPDDISPWRLAVVIEVKDKSVIAGLEPTLLANGKVAPERQGAEIPLKQMAWARAAQPDGGLGPKITKPSQVLEVGDVIYKLAMSSMCLPRVRVAPGNWHSYPRWRVPSSPLTPIRDAFSPWLAASALIAASSTALLRPCASPVRHSSHLSMPPPSTMATPRQRWSWTRPSPLTRGAIRGYGDRRTTAANFTGPQLYVWALKNRAMS